MSEKASEESLLKDWSEAQQKLLTDWLDTLRNLGGASALELWSKEARVAWSRATSGACHTGSTA